MKKLLLFLLSPAYVISKELAEKTKNFRNMKEKISFLPESLTETLIYTGIVALSNIHLPYISNIYRSTSNPTLQALTLLTACYYAGANATGIMLVWSKYRPT